MALSSRRKRVNTILGLLLLSGLIYLFWPFVVGRGQMQAFCASLLPGATLAQVQGKASAHDYRVSSLIEGQAFVHDPRSMGRFNCVLHFAQNGLASSPYADND
jgi:hypothetical protein